MHLLQFPGRRPLVLGLSHGEMRRNYGGANGSAINEIRVKVGRVRTQTRSVLYIVDQEDRVRIRTKVPQPRASLCLPSTLETPRQLWRYR